MSASACDCGVVPGGAAGSVIVTVSVCRSRHSVMRRSAESVRILVGVIDVPTASVCGRTSVVFASWRPDGGGGELDGRGDDAVAVEIEVDAAAVHEAEAQLLRHQVDEEADVAADADAVHADVEAALGGAEVGGAVEIDRAGDDVEAAADAEKRQEAHRDGEVEGGGGDVDELADEAARPVGRPAEVLAPLREQAEAERDVLAEALAEEQDRARAPCAWPSVVTVPVVGSADVAFVAAKMRLPPTSALKPG